jgi:hypothetical protein
VLPFAQRLHAKIRTRAGPNPSPMCRSRPDGGGRWPVCATR